MDKQNETYLKMVSKIAEKLNSFEDNIPHFDELKTAITNYLEEISKNEMVIKLCENIEINKIYGESKEIGRQIAHRLGDGYMGRSSIRRNLYVLCLRMSAIANGVDMRKGDRYAGNPINGRRVINVAKALGIKHTKNLQYPLNLGDAILWYPGMVRTGQYITLLKSKCSWKRIFGELDAFDEMEREGKRSGDNNGLSQSELARMRQFFNPFAHVNSQKLSE